MKGKSTFTDREAKDIRIALTNCRTLDRDAQKDIRENELRRRLNFYISDFTKSKKGFSPDDFDNLIKSGKVIITGKVGLSSFEVIPDSMVDGRENQ